MTFLSHFCVRSNRTNVTSWTHFVCSIPRIKQISIIQIPTKYTHVKAFTCMLFAPTFFIFRVSWQEYRCVWENEFPVALACTKYEIHCSPLWEEDLKFNSSLCKRTYLVAFYPRLLDHMTNLISCRVLSTFGAGSYDQFNILSHFIQVRCWIIWPI